MTINKKTYFSTATATESERQILSDVYNTCVKVSEDDSVCENLEEILEVIVSDLICYGKCDFSQFYQD